MGAAVLDGASNTADTADVLMTAAAAAAVASAAATAVSASASCECELTPPSSHAANSGRMPAAAMPALDALVVCDDDGSSGSRARGAIAVDGARTVVGSSSSSAARLSSSAVECSSDAALTTLALLALPVRGCDVALPLAPLPDRLGRGGAAAVPVPACEPSMLTLDLRLFGPLDDREADCSEPDGAATVTAIASDSDASPAVGAATGTSSACTAPESNIENTTRTASSLALLPSSNFTWLSAARATLPVPLVPERPREPLGAPDARRDCCGSGAA
jgi:hypothetical protein